MAIKPVIGIIMGSDSDFPVIEPALKVLDEFQVDYEVIVSSAHRTPERTATYVSSAVKKGIKVLIAAAGGAAHLPGVVAAMTVLPVIGVPIRSKAFNGMDSLLSIVEMPKGVPVGTVGVDNAVNAALLALRILGVSTPAIAKKLRSYNLRQANQVILNDKALQKKIRK